VLSFTPRPLYPRYPLDRRLGGPQSPYGRRGEEKILDPTGSRTPTPRPSSPVASRYTDYAIPAPAIDRSIASACLYCFVLTNVSFKLMHHEQKKENDKLECKAKVRID
jgi:hypothetical protein